MPAKKSLGSVNLERYNSLWAKVPAKVRSNWTPALLQKHFQPWEVAYLLASMHEGVAQNGGAMHGLCCFFDDLDAVIAAWSNVGAVKIAEYLQQVRERAVALGSLWKGKPIRPDDGLSPELYQQLHTFADALPQEDMATVERLLDEYWRKHT